MSDRVAGEWDKKSEEYNYVSHGAGVAEWLENGIKKKAKNIICESWSRRTNE